MNICLFGGSGNNVDRAYIEAGEALGRAIARRGHTLVFGGGAGGLMGAAARGVREEAGKSIGIIPEMFKGTEFGLRTVRNSFMRKRSASARN